MKSKINEIGIIKIILKLFAILGTVYLIFSGAVDSNNEIKISLMLFLSIILPIAQLFFSHSFFILIGKKMCFIKFFVSMMFFICFFGSSWFSSNYIKNNENKNYNNIKINTAEYKENRENEKINNKIKESLINKINNKKTYENIKTEVMKDPRIISQQKIINNYPQNYITLRNKATNELNKMISDITKEYEQKYSQDSIDNDTLSKLLIDNKKIKNKNSNIISTKGILSQAQGVSQIIYGEKYTEKQLSLILTIICWLYSGIIELIIIGFNILDPKAIAGLENKQKKETNKKIKVDLVKKFEEVKDSINQTVIPITSKIEEKKKEILKTEYNKEKNITEYILNNLKKEGDREYVKIKEIKNIFDKNGISKTSQIISKYCNDYGIEYKLTGGYKKYLVNLDEFKNNIDKRLETI